MYSKIIRGTRGRRYMTILADSSELVLVWILINQFDLMTPSKSDRTSVSGFCNYAYYYEFVSLATCLLSHLIYIHNLEVVKAHNINITSNYIKLMHSK